MKVKPLVWDKEKCWCGNVYSGRIRNALGLGCRYTIYPPDYNCEDDGYDCEQWLCDKTPTEFCSGLKTLEEALAACQAHFEKWVLSLLEE